MEVIKSKERQSVEIEERLAKKMRAIHNVKDSGRRLFVFGWIC